MVKSTELRKKAMANPVIQNLLMECPSGGPYHYGFCYGFPKEGEMEAILPARMLFQKYDDGWRLKQMLDHQ